MSGSNDAITDMINAHYKGIIDISDYWSVGSIRNVTLSIMATFASADGYIFYPNSNYTTMNVDLVIIGINHDTLSTKNGTRTKAAITVQTLGCIGYGSPAAYDIEGPGYSFWSSSMLRTWCNNEFKSALPSYLQNLIKSVTKLSNTFCSSRNYSNYKNIVCQSSTTDDCFFLSEYEIFGSTYSGYHNGYDYGTLDGDGTQYKYMKISTYRYKTDLWWGRTGVGSSGSSAYICVSSTGGETIAVVNNCDIHLAPAFCL